MTAAAPCLWTQGISSMTRPLTQRRIVDRVPARGGGGSANAS
jgi:hypothetical protein